MAKKMTKQQKSVFTMFAVVSIIALSTYFGIGYRGDVIGISENGIEFGFAGLRISDNVAYDDRAAQVDVSTIGDFAFIDVVSPGGSSDNFVYYEDGYMNGEAISKYGTFRSGFGGTSGSRFSLDMDNGPIPSYEDHCATVFGSMDDIYFDGITDDDLEKDSYLVLDYESNQYFECNVYYDVIEATVKLGLQAESFDEVAWESSSDKHSPASYHYLDLILNINIENLVYDISESSEYENFGISYIDVSAVNTHTTSEDNDPHFWNSGEHNYLRSASAISMNTNFKDLLLNEIIYEDLPREFINFEDIFYKNMYCKLSFDGINGRLVIADEFKYWYESGWYVDYLLNVGIMVLVATPTEDIEPITDLFDNGFIDERDTSGSLFWDFFFRMIEWTDTTVAKTILIIVGIVVGIGIFFGIFIGWRKTKYKKQKRLYDVEQKIRAMVQNNRIVAKMGDLTSTVKEKASETYGSVKKVFDK